MTYTESKASILERLLTLVGTSRQGSIVGRNTVRNASEDKREAQKFELSDAKAKELAEAVKAAQDKADAWRKATRIDQDAMKKPLVRA